MSGRKDYEKRFFFNSSDLSLYLDFISFSKLILPTDITNVVKISTNLIQGDVSVTDKTEGSVTDLKPGRFQDLQRDNQRRA